LDGIKTQGAISYMIYNLIIPTLVILGAYLLLAKLLKIEEVDDF
jgi:hypothetical protein